jgi:hypothetical protein
MIPGREFLERCSTGTGFRVAALEKVVRLGEVVGAIGGLLAILDPGTRRLGCGESARQEHDHP